MGDLDVANAPLPGPTDGDDFGSCLADGWAHICMQPALKTRYLKGANMSEGDSVIEKLEVCNPKNSICHVHPHSSTPQT